MQRAKERKIDKFSAKNQFLPSRNSEPDGIFIQSEKLYVFIGKIILISRGENDGVFNLLPKNVETEEFLMVSCDNGATL